MSSNKLKLIIVFSVVTAAGFTFYVTNFIRSIPKLDPIGTPQVTPTMNGLPAGDLSNLISVDEPESGQVITGSPLVVSGQARGYWFFEASFPVRIYDDNGVELGVVPAQAQGEWMTENFVPFRAVLNFQKPITQRGTLVFEKDNPSGLPEHDASLSLPIFFDLNNWPDSSVSPIGGPTSPPTGPTAKCVVGGCSSQLCVDESEGDVISTCEYKAEYACYRTAKCERQEDGKCGWTPTEELVACITSAWQSEGDPAPQ